MRIMSAKGGKLPPIMQPAASNGLKQMGFDVTSNTREVLVKAIDYLDYEVALEADPPVLNYYFKANQLGLPATSVSTPLTPPRSVKVLALPRALNDADPSSTKIVGVAYGTNIVASETVDGTTTTKMVSIRNTVFNPSNVPQWMLVGSTDFVSAMNNGLGVPLTDGTGQSYQIFSLACFDPDDGSQLTGIKIQLRVETTYALQLPLLGYVDQAAVYTQQFSLEPPDAVTTSRSYAQVEYLRLQNAQ